MELTQHQADAFARMPLTYLRQEYPNQPRPQAGLLLVHR